MGIFLENSSEKQIGNNALNQTGFGIGSGASTIEISNCENCYNYLNPPDSTQTGSKRNVVAFNR